MKNASKFVLALAIAVAIPTAVLACEPPDTAAAGANSANSANGANGAQKAVAVGMSEGEIKKIDKDAGKITIKHGPLVNLGMPGMTMVFRVKDVAMLGQIKAGDKVNFNAEKLNGALTVTAIEPSK